MLTTVLNHCNILLHAVIFHFGQSGAGLDWINVWNIGPTKWMSRIRSRSLPAMDWFKLEMD